MMMRQSWRPLLCVLSALVLGGVAEAWAGNPSAADESVKFADVLPGRSAAGNYLAGRVAQRRDDWPNSWRLMAAALKQDQGNTELVRQGFLSAVGAGRVAEASELAKRIVAFDAQNYFATTLLVAEEFANADHDRAKQRLLGMSSRGANRLLVPLLIGWAEAGLGNKEAALGALKAQARTTNPVFALHAGLIADHLGDPGEAAEWFDQLGEGTRLPGRTMRLIGAVYERAGQTEKARAYYERWIEFGPDVVIGEIAFDRMTQGRPPEAALPTARDGAGEAFLDLASALRQESANDLSLLYAQLAAYLRPGSSAIQLLLGDVLAESRNYDQAIRHYSEVDRSADLWWTAQLRTADALDRGKRTDEAVALLQNLSRDFPDRIDALTLLGDLFRRGKRFGEAVVAYDQALARVPEVHQRHWSLFYARGVASERAQNWAQAEKDLLKALELQPNHPQVLNYLAYAWAEQGINLDRAYEMLQRAVSLRPNDGHIIDSLGWVLYRMGRFDEAVAKLERAVELEPQEPEVNEHLGDLYWQVGRRLEARFQWRRALQQNPDETVAAGIREKLEHGMSAVSKTAGTGPASR